jgi:hypothetical protein
MGFGFTDAERAEGAERLLELTGNMAELCQQNLRSQLDAERQRAEEAEAEVFRLKEIVKGADDGGNWYSQQTMNAMVKERSRLQLLLSRWRDKDETDDGAQLYADTIAEIGDRRG